MFYGTKNIPWNILTLRWNVGIFNGILSIPHNIVMDLNDVMQMTYIAFALSMYQLVKSPQQVLKPTFI